MAQYLKEEIRRRIAGAALRVFAREGYDGATMAEIARDAGVSTGNVYRYYDGKEALFEAVVPERRMRRFRALLTGRLRSAAGAGDVRALPPDHPYVSAADALMDFAVEHRLELVILLGGKGGSRYAEVPGDVIDELVGAALEHSPSLAERAERSAAVAFDVVQVYRNFVATLVAILERFDDPTGVREATETFERYHLGGLASLME